MKVPSRMPKLNKEQKAYQTARDWGYLFAGFITVGMPAFILGFELVLLFINLYEYEEFELIKLESEE